MTDVCRRTQLLRCELLTRYSGRSDELRAALPGPTNEGYQARVNRPGRWQTADSRQQRILDLQSRPQSIGLTGRRVDHFTQDRAWICDLDRTLVTYPTGASITSRRTMSGSPLRSQTSNCSCWLSPGSKQLRHRAS